MILATVWSPVALFRMVNVRNLGCDGLGDGMIGWMGLAESFRCRRAIDDRRPPKHRRHGTVGRS